MREKRGTLNTIRTSDNSGFKSDCQTFDNCILSSFFQDGYKIERTPESTLATYNKCAEENGTYTDEKTGREGKLYTKPNDYATRLGAIYPPLTDRNVYEVNLTITEAV